MALLKNRFGISNHIIIGKARAKKTTRKGRSSFLIIKL